MKPVSLTLLNVHEPQVLVSAEDFLLVYKPPKMHSAPGKGASLAEWCGSLFPEIRGISRRGNSGGGRNSGASAVATVESGLLHRLDYETQGLVLFARNQGAFEILLDEQDQGEVVKEYGALVSKAEKTPPGFPPFAGVLKNKKNIESYFRPYGPGRKEVRPVPLPVNEERPASVEISKDKGTPYPYRTEILDPRSATQGGIEYFRLRITRGFRHQIRCHLAWAGFPVINDPLYGGHKFGKGILALRAEGIRFTYPRSTRKLYYTLPPLDIQDL